MSRENGLGLTDRATEPFLAKRCVRSDTVLRIGVYVAGGEHGSDMSRSRQTTFFGSRMRMNGA